MYNQDVKPEWGGQVKYRSNVVVVFEKMCDPRANKSPCDAGEDGVDVFDASLQIEVPARER